MRTPLTIISATAQVLAKQGLSRLRYNIFWVGLRLHLHVCSSVL